MLRVLTGYISLVWLCLGTVAVQAQDDPQEPPIKTGGAIVVRAANAGPDGEVVVGQTIIAGSPMEGNMQFFAAPALGMFGTPEMESMLQDNQIQQELGLVEDQMNEIREIQKEFSRQMQEQSQSLFSDGKFDPARAREMGEQMRTVQATMKKKINGVLLPHQQQRLQQLSYHVEMQNRPGGEAIFQGRIADELELTEEQRAKLEERAGEIEQELEEKIAELKKKAREDLLKGLTSEQRKKLDEMLGEEFQYSAPKAPRSIRRNGARPIKINRSEEK